MKKFYMPTTDSGRDLWLKNFAAKLPQYVAKYGINNTELADVQLSAQNHTFWLNFKNQLDEVSKKTTGFKNEQNDGNKTGLTFTGPPVLPSLGTPPAAVAPGIFIRIQSIVQRIKKHLSYTEADGNDLGIEGTKATVNLETIKPKLSIRFVEAGKPQIVWSRNGMTALEIFVDRGDGFKFLALDVMPNYTDRFELEDNVSAVWKYKAVYQLNDERVGIFSDEIKVTVTGGAKSA